MRITSSIRTILCTSLWFLFSLSVIGQPKDWGDISRETLQMEQYAPDKSAAAVVLFEKGNLRIKDEFTYFLDKHVRIKILREEGYDWGTVTIDYNEYYDQEIEDIEAITYNLGSDGKSITKHKLDEDLIYDENIIDNWNQKKFTFPALQPGSIIEYKYTLKMEYPAYIPPWFFDRTIPVQWSEFSAEFPAFLNYTKVYKGNDELSVNETESYDKTVQYKYESEISGAYRDIKKTRNLVFTFNVSRFRWVMKERPAIEKLPYMTAVDNFKSRIEFQLAELNIPRRSQVDFMKTWSNVIDYLFEEADYDIYLTDNEDFDTVLNNLVEKDLTPIKKVRAIFEYVANNYNWNKIYGTLPEQQLDDLVEKKSGTGVELNLLLTRLLREAGFDANPVLISTRYHGDVFKDYVLPDQFNHVIVHIQLKDQTLLLDSITGNRPLLNLPENDLNGQGLIIKKPYLKNLGWVDIIPFRQTVKVGKVQANIKSDGSVQGNTSYQTIGYWSYDERTMMSESGKSHFINNHIFEEFDKVDINNFTHNNLAAFDSVLTYSANFNSAVPSSIQKTDSLIFFENRLFSKWKSNPFKRAERKYPVSLPYQTVEKLTTAYRIPTGYEVEDYPADLTINIGDNAGVFKRETEVKHGQVIIRSTIQLLKLVYLPAEYSELRNFYNKIIEAHAEKIVFKKRQP